MTERLELLQEANRRGILPPDKQPLFDEAVRRGLVPETVADATDPDEVVKRGLILPVGRERDGDLTMALPKILEGPRQTIVGLLEGNRTAEQITGKEVFELGGILGGGSVAGKAATKGLPSAFARTEGREVADAATRIGVDLPRAVTSDSTAVQQTGKIAANIPIGGTPLRKTSQTAIEQLGKAADDAQGQLGSGSIPSAGGQARAGIETQITERTAQRVGERYDKVDTLVDANAKAPLTDTAATVAEITARRGEAGISGQSQATRIVDEAISRPEGISYQGTKDLRTFIGQMLDNPSALPADIPKAELKQIYGALTKDLRRVVGIAGGGRASRAFESANSFASRQSSINKQLNTLLKAKSNEATFDKIIATAGSTSRADIALLRKARGALDKQTWNEVSSAVISRLGRDADGNFSPDRFLTAYGKLTGEGKRVLFRSTGRGDVAGALDDIAVVSRRFKLLNQFANPSGTGQTVIGAGAGVGLITEPLTAVTSILGARAISSLLARPATARPLAQWIRSYSRAVTKQTGQAALQRSSRLLAVRVADELGIPELVPRITQELQGAVPGKADEQAQ